MSARAGCRVTRLDSAGKRSLRLVSDLLDFAAARSAGIKLVQVPCDLHAVVDSAIDDLRAIWPSRRIDHEPSGDGLSSFDGDRIAQAVASLIGNALQHSPPDSTVRVTTRGEDAEVVFEVSNTGAPIPAELLPELFEPLRRGRAAGDRRGSLGLGLFIVRHLVLAHGGTIEVTSSAADGTRFTIRLPRARSVE